MKIIKTAIATTVALAACSNIGLLAADTTVATSPAVQPAHPKIGGPAPGQTLSNGWYGPGWDGGMGYYNPAVSGQYDPYPFYNIVGGESYGLLYVYSLPNQNESPFNPAAALTRHEMTLSLRSINSAKLTKEAAQPVPPSSAPDAH